MKKIKRLNLSHLFESRKFNFIFSILVAIVCWYFVATTIETQHDGIVEDVPVNFSVGMVSVTSQGLNILGTPEATVDIMVTGERALVGSLRASDFNVVVRYDNVTGAGSYSLPISVTKADNYADFAILSVTPLSVEIEVDRIETISMPVSVDISDIVIEEGYIAGLPSATPAEITIQGSRSEVSRISSAVVSYEGTTPLNERAVGAGEILLYDVDGGEIITTGLTLSASEAEISIPIQKIGMMKTKVEFINAPDGFDIDTLNYEITPSEIRVSGSEGDIDQAGDLLLGYIDLKNFSMNYGESFEVVLPSGFTNLDNINTAQVVFDTEDMSERTVVVEDFTIKNAIAGMEVNLDNLIVQGVTLVGDAETLETLASGSVIGEIDSDDINVTQGVQEVPIKIQIPTADNIFAIGEYTVAIEIS